MPFVLHHNCTRRAVLNRLGSTWVAQQVERPTLAQVTISQLVNSSPTWGSLLSAQSPLRILCPHLSLSLPLLSKINIKKNKLNRLTQMETEAQ